MLLPRQLPAAHEHWNRARGAPHGRRIARALPRRLRSLPGIAQWAGMFGFQPNSDTRRFEYPWAFEALALRPGMRVLEIGGSSSGFQFAVARSGCKVVNVDPGEQARGVGWPVTPSWMDRLNRRFGTAVELRNCFIEDAGLTDASFERAVSLSTLEHIPLAEIPAILGHVERALVPGGLFVLTVDLFLDLAPFTEVVANRWGTNVSIRWMLESTGFELVTGRRDQLYGFDEFDPAAVRATVAELAVGRSWPVLVQALVVRKPSRD